MVIHLLLALAVVGLASSFAGFLYGLVSAVLMAVLLVLMGVNQPRGELRVIHRGSVRGSFWGEEESDWAWRDGPGDPWRSVRLDCNYLGPWLLGLRLDGRRLWLWPDSSDRDALRALRRELISLC